MLILFIFIMIVLTLNMQLLDNTSHVHVWYLLLRIQLYVVHVEEQILGDTLL